MEGMIILLENMNDEVGLICQQHPSLRKEL